MAKELDKNEQFYEKYLTEPDRDIHAVITGLGLATFRVLNQELIDGIKKITWADEVEGEFSFIRNKHLHYKPCMDDGVASAGVLTFRASKTGGISVIRQFTVIHSLENNQIGVAPFSNECVAAYSCFDTDGPTASALPFLTNIIAGAFNND